MNVFINYIDIPKFDDTITNHTKQALKYAILDKSTCQPISGDLGDAAFLKTVRIRTYEYFMLICPVCIRFYLMSTVRRIKNSTFDVPKSF